MINRIVGEILMLIGGIFLFLGGLGIIRMPDVYNRMQAGTKATTLGALSLLIGVGIYHPAFLLKSLLIAIFILLTNPIASHVLARASHHICIKMEKCEVDRYKEDKEKGVIK